MLSAAGIRTAGAGATLDEALAPAMIDLEEWGRVLVFGLGTKSSGIPETWAARPHTSGVALLPRLDERTALALGERIAAVRRPRDIVVVSCHWGSNWGWDVDDDQVLFARRLVELGADVVHGHSSHHPRPVDVHRGKLILHGCGELVDDYEGIEGHEVYRGELVLLYFARVRTDGGELVGLRMTPMRIRRFRLERADVDDARCPGTNCCSYCLERARRGRPTSGSIGDPVLAAQERVVAEC